MLAQRASCVKTAGEQQTAESMVCLTSWGLSPTSHIRATVLTAARKTRQCAEIRP
jgi:hypothetical protein